MTKTQVLSFRARSKISVVTCTGVALIGIAIATFGFGASGCSNSNQSPPEISPPPTAEGAHSEQAAAGSQPGAVASPIAAADPSSQTDTARAHGTESAQGHASSGSTKPAGHGESKVSAEREVIAALSQIVETVKVRRKGTLTWKPVREGTDLAELASQDAVQTEARSRATIVFKSGSQIQMGAKSLVVISPPTNKGMPQQADRAVVRGGDLQSTTTKELWLMTSAALFKMKPAPDGTAAKANFSIKEGNRIKVKLEAGRAVAVTVAKAPAAKNGGVEASPTLKEVSLVVDKPMSLPAPAAPESFGVETSPEKPGAEPEWTQDLIKTLSTQHLTQKKAELQRPHQEKKAPASGPGHTAAVSATDSSPAKASGTAASATGESAASAKRVQPAAPPKLQVQEPRNKSETTADKVRVQGSVDHLNAEGAARGKVLVQGQEARWLEGQRFEAEAALDVGVNLILVQWISAEGVSQYKRVTVTRK